MKFKTLLLALVMSAGTLAMSTPVPVAAEELVENADLLLGRVKIFVNGKRVYKKTLLYNDSTYLPLRALAEALGKEIVYDPVTVTAHINNVPTEYEPSEPAPDIDEVQEVASSIYIGRTKLMVDGQDVPQETLLYNDSAYAPLRAVAEMMNMDVSYDDSIKSAMLYDKGTDAPTPRTISYYEDFPTVVDFGIFAKLTEDRIKMSVEEDGTKFLYLNITDDVIGEYKDALIGEGFELAQIQEETDISVYKKEFVSVTVDNFTFKATNLLVIVISVTEPFSYPNEFPSVPLFAPETPFQTAPTVDGRGFVYSYTGISEEKIHQYVDELIRLGYAHNTVSSAADFNVYGRDEYTVTLDATRRAAESIVSVTIRNEIFMFQKEFPTVPTLAQIKPENTTPSEDGNGYAYWYKDAGENLINDYINELSRLGYVTDAAQSRAGYYAYKKGDIFVLIDTVTHKSNGFVLLTISKELNIVYYPNYPTVPSFPARIETTSPNEDGTGTIYWHLNVADATVKEYAAMLVKLGYAADSANTRDGYLVYVKDGIAVVLDSITRQANGFFLLAIKNVGTQAVLAPGFISYRTYPSVPDIGSYSDSYILPFNLTKDGDSIETYWYFALDNAVVQNYLKALIDNNFTNIADSSSDGHWVYQKDNLNLTIDTASYPGQYTLVIIDTQNVINNYTIMPEVPDFATVVKKYWTISGDRIEDRPNGYNYKIREGNADSATGYIGDVSLYSAYNQYLEANGFVLDSVQPELSVTENETRRDTLYDKGGLKLMVSESVIADDTGYSETTITVQRVN